MAGDSEKLKVFEDSVNICRKLKNPGNLAFCGKRQIKPESIAVKKVIFDWIFNIRLFLRFYDANHFFEVDPGA